MCSGDSQQDGGGITACRRGVSAVGEPTGCSGGQSAAMGRLIGAAGEGELQGGDY